MNSKREHAPFQLPVKNKYIKIRPPFVPLYMRPPSISQQPIHICNVFIIRPPLTNTFCLETTERFDRHKSDHENATHRTQFDVDLNVYIYIKYTLDREKSEATCNPYTQKKTHTHNSFRPVCEGSLSSPHN